MAIPLWLRDPTVLAIIGVAATIVCTILGILVTYRFTKRKHEAQITQIREENEGLKAEITYIEADTVNIGRFSGLSITKKEGSN